MPTDKEKSGMSPDATQLTDEELDEMISRAFSRPKPVARHRDMVIFNNDDETPDWPRLSGKSSTKEP